MFNTTYNKGFMPSFQGELFRQKLYFESFNQLKTQSKVRSLDKTPKVDNQSQKIISPKEVKSYAIRLTDVNLEDDDEVEQQYNEVQYLRKSMQRQPTSTFNYSHKEKKADQETFLQKQHTERQMRKIIQLSMKVQFKSDITDDLLEQQSNNYQNLISQTRNIASSDLASQIQQVSQFY